jgi:hypothetical protein
VEIRSPAGSAERRFLHAIVAGPSDMRAPGAVAISGDAADGAVIDDEAYVFARSGVAERPSPLAYEAPAAARRHIVASLAPGGHYEVDVVRDGDRCRVSLQPGAGRVASKAGVVAIEIAGGCSLR